MTFWGLNNYLYQEMIWFYEINLWGQDKKQLLITKWSYAQWYLRNVPLKVISKSLIFYVYLQFETVWLGHTLLWLSSFFRLLGVYCFRQIWTFWVIISLPLHSFRAPSWPTAQWCSTHFSLSLFSLGFILNDLCSLASSLVYNV